MKIAGFVFPVLSIGSGAVFVDGSSVRFKVNHMIDDRCFRITDDDIDDLRDQTRDQQLIDAYARWVNSLALRVDEVIDQICYAFSGITLGEGIGLFEAQGLDDYASSEEQKELERRMRSSTGVGSRNWTWLAVMRRLLSSILAGSFFTFQHF